MTAAAKDELVLYRVGALRDARHVWKNEVNGLSARPGAIMVRQRDRHALIEAAGEETQVRRKAGTPDRVIDRPDLLVMPGMVNAHAHLDLTDLGPRPYGGNFIDWVRMIMQSRATDDDAIRAAMRQGVTMSRNAGVVLLADIAGSDTALYYRAHGDEILGWSFREVLGFGQRGLDSFEDACVTLKGINEDRLLAFTDHRHDLLCGLQPHAPYSTGLEVYERANTRPGNHSTHLAETIEECEFTRDATGPFADLLRKLGKWDDSIKPRGVSPVQYLRDILAAAPLRWIVAHCNYVDDADIETLAATRTHVVYCPVASDYFGHRNHRYRDMLAAGVNVCLGTDSIVCQPPGEPQPLGILPQMRHLYRRDHTDPLTLLAMATTRGSDAMLGHYHSASVSHGDAAELVAVRFDPDDPTDPLVQVLMNDHAVELLVHTPRINTG